MSEANPKKLSLRDDHAYILPMAVFLGLVWVGGNWPKFYPIAYVARAAIVAVLLVVCWKHYAKIKWDYWWLGALLGIVTIFQWVGMQLFLQNHFAIFKPSPDAFDPTKEFAGSPVLMWSWIAVRIASASLVVPVMEELFWRDFVWRTIIAPNNFKLAKVGEWSAAAFFAVALVFATVHGSWWLTAIAWALIINSLLVKTRSLGACMVMHGMTNLLLGAYVLWTKQWYFW